MNSDALIPTPSDAAAKAVAIANSPRAQPLLTIDFIGRERKRQLLIAILTELLTERTPPRSEPAVPSAVRPGVISDAEDTNRLGGPHNPEGARLRESLAATKYFTAESPLMARVTALLSLVQERPEAKCSPDNVRLALALLLADTVRQVQEDAGKEAAELRVQLEAWQNQFGSTQLSHAVAKQEAIVRALEIELAPLRETVGVRLNAATSTEDLSNWVKLVERADRAYVAEAANVALRNCLESFANPDRWRDRSPGLQWFSKRNPIEYAATILKENVVPKLAGATIKAKYIVEGMDPYGRWTIWNISDENKSLNPCASLEEAVALKKELDEYRTSERTGWKDSRIILETVTRQVVSEISL